MTPTPSHVARDRPMLCADAEGRGLAITIRLSADGRVYLHDIPPAFLPIAAALVPQDHELAKRAAVLAERLPPP